MLIDAYKMECLYKHLASLTWRNIPGIGGTCSALANAFRFAEPVMLETLLQEFGDTHRGSNLVDYLKHLDALDFEQFADFPMSAVGRTLAFVRNRGCILALLGVELGRPLSLELFARSVGDSVVGHTVGFPNNVVRLNSGSPSAYRIAFDGISGLRIKLRHLERETNLSDAWWSLDDRGYGLRSDIGDELVSQRDRFLCEDYNDVKRLIDARREAIPSMYRFQFDADHRFKLVDVLSRNHSTSL
jgi:hypothetical protein